MATTKQPLVLVTGASSFVGSHIVLELLKDGYAVRGTTRSGKLEALRSSVASKHDKLDIVLVDDIATDDLGPALEGVDSIIHVASPLAGQVAPQKAIEVAIEGTLNVLRQAKKLGVFKVVITSSWGTTLDPSLKQVYEGKTFTASDWGQVTEEEILNLHGDHHPLWTYLGTKILAEKAAWKFAKENPELDVATINPPFIYGPNAADFPPPSAVGLGTNRMIYGLISGEAGRPLTSQVAPFFCDVRDVARAHVAALKVPRKQQDKRYLVSGGAFSWKDAVVHIAQTLPDLVTRLPSVYSAPAFPGTLSSIDVTPAKEDLGLGEYIPWERTVIETVVSLLKVERGHGWVSLKL